MLFAPQKKHREFNLSKRLGKTDSNDKEHRIKIERLPRRPVRPLWLTLFVFLLVIYLLYYLSKF